MKINKPDKCLAAIASVLSLAATANAAFITSFTNLDFDSGAVSTAGNYNGFDNPNCEIVGWSNLNAPGSLADAGVEGPGAWWSPYEDKSAFMKAGDGGFNLSTYTIQSDDVFDVGIMAKDWATWNGSTAQLTITLFYGSDPTQNLIGSFNTGTLPKGGSSAWTHYADTAIAATPGSVGQTLGISVLSSGSSDSYANFDEATVNVIPEPGSMALVVLGGLGMLTRSRRRS